MSEQFQYQVFDKVDQRVFIQNRCVDMVRAAELADGTVFLDKSGRPLAHIFSLLFPLVYPLKPIPTTSYVNIGTEKFDAMREYLYQTHTATQKATRAMLTSQITDRESLNSIFGKEHVEELETLLNKTQGRNKLIIDDIRDKGDTKILAERIFSLLDPSSTYSYFALLDKTEHRRSPIPGLKPSLPWGSHMTLRRDQTNNGIRDLYSFTTAHETNPTNIQKGHLLLDELDEFIFELTGVGITDPNLLR